MADEPPDLETLVRRYQRSDVEMEILTPAEEPVRLGVEGAPGIQVALGNMQGTLVYELKVPLEKTGEFPYAIGTEPGKELTLSLDTTAFDREKMPQERPDGMKVEGDMEGGRGPGPGGMRGGPPPGSMGDFGPLEVRAKVRLATGKVE